MPIQTRKKSKVAPDHFTPLTMVRWVVALGVLGAIWIGLNYRTLSDYFVSRVHRNENTRAVLELDRQHSELMSEKQQLERWGFPAEKAIRERFKMGRPGERVMLIAEPSEPETHPPPRLENQPSQEE